MRSDLFPPDELALAGGTGRVGDDDAGSDARRQSDDIDPLRATASFGPRQLRCDCPAIRVPLRVTPACSGVVSGMTANGVVSSRHTRRRTMREASDETRGGRILPRRASMPTSAGEGTEAASSSAPGVRSGGTTTEALIKASVEASLMKYVALREAGPMPLLSVEEQRAQARWGIRHVAALDPGRDASFVSIHHKIWSQQQNRFIFPGSAHSSLDGALKDALYWADKGYDVYWAMGGQARAGEHKPGLPYPSAIRKEYNTVACRCLYADVDVKPDKAGYGLRIKTQSGRGVEGLRSGARAFAPTLIVGSGTGRFPRLLATPGELITPVKFKPMAAALAKAAWAHRLMFDAQVHGRYLPLCCASRGHGISRTRTNRATRSWTPRDGRSQPSSQSRSSTEKIHASDRTRRPKRIHN